MPSSNRYGKDKFWQEQQGQVITSRIGKNLHTQPTEATQCNSPLLANQRNLFLSIELMTASDRHSHNGCPSICKLTNANDWNHASASHLECWRNFYFKVFQMLQWLQGKFHSNIASLSVFLFNYLKPFASWFELQMFAQCSTFSGRCYRFTASHSRSTFCLEVGTTSAV